eukprot:m.131579 g.131579  ORF g.131579 m.131579 type:complete len:239 (-) comp29557_c0_seq2:92-808(-)
MAFQCVHCGTSASKLYVEFHGDNVQLQKCKSCRKLVDPYIEYDLALLFLFLLMHRPGVLTHLLYNRHSLPKRIGTRTTKLVRSLPIIVSVAEAYITCTCDVPDPNEWPEANELVRTSMVILLGNLIMYLTLFVLARMLCAKQARSNVLFTGLMFSQLSAVVLAVVVVCGEPDVVYTYMLSCTVFLASLKMAFDLHASMGVVVVVAGWICRQGSISVLWTPLMHRLLEDYLHTSQCGQR